MCALFKVMPSSLINMSLALLCGQEVADKIVKQKEYVLEPMTSFFDNS